MVRIATSVLLAALLSGTVLGASPAAAHDQLTGTEPRADQVVAAMPDAVRLAFSGNPMAIGTTVLVVDAAGKRLGSAQPIVDGNVVSLRLPHAPTDAWYQVRWRVVSADGHLLSGSFDFGVGDPSSAPKPGLAGSPGGQVADVPESSSEPAGGSIPQWGVALIGAALALAVWWLGSALPRRRRLAARTTAPNEGVRHE